MMNEKQQEWWCIDFSQAQGISDEIKDALCERLLRFTPDLVLGVNRVFLEMSRTKKFTKFEAFMLRARVIGERLGVEAGLWRFGIAETLPRAWIQTRWRVQDPAHLPLEAYYDFINPLGNFEMNRPMRERISVFRALGMKSLGDLFTVPKEAWLVRFGEEFDLFLEHYEHGNELPWKRFVSATPLTEEGRWNAEDQVMDAENLIFWLKPLIDRLCVRLYSLRCSLKKLELILKIDRKGPDRRIELKFAFPQTSRVLLLKLLREKLSHEMQREPLKDPVVGIQASVLETAKRSESSARFSFSEQEERLDQEKEGWLELISYLGIKLGDQGRVYQAQVTEHLLPEFSWKTVLGALPGEGAALDRVSQLYPERPVRLLPEPRRLGRTGTYLKLGERSYRICEVSGPEHLAGHEWDVEGVGAFERSYFRVRVETPEGDRQEWWVYKDEHQGDLNLHGVY